MIVEYHTLLSRRYKSAQQCMVLGANLTIFKIELFIILKHYKMISDIDVL